MYLNGRPYLPPRCPVIRGGAEIDLSKAPFIWNSHDCQNDGAGKPTVTEMFGSFVAGKDHEDFVETDSLIVPVGSADADLAFQIGDGENTRVEEGDRLELMRRKFCERIMQCHGVVNGECWALGSEAVHAVLREVVRE